MWSRPVFWWMPYESCESVHEGAPLVATKVEDFELLKTWAVLSKKNEVAETRFPKHAMQRSSEWMWMFLPTEFDKILCECHFRNLTT